MQELIIKLLVNYTQYTVIVLESENSSIALKLVQSNDFHNHLVSIKNIKHQVQLNDTCSSNERRCNWSKTDFVTKAKSGFAFFQILFPQIYKNHVFLEFFFLKRTEANIQFFIKTHFYKKKKLWIKRPLYYGVNKIHHLRRLIWMFCLCFLWIARAFIYYMASRAATSHTITQR